MSEPRIPPPPSRRFAASWWLEQARICIWVAVVTALIWIYADMEFTEAKEFTATIHFESPPGSKLVLLSKNDIEVTFKAQGNRASLERFESLKKTRSNRIDVDLSTFKPGQAVVRAEEILLKDMDLVKSGLNVLSASPSPLPLDLDRLVTVKDVRVELDYSGATLARAPVVAPATVSVQVAQSLWERLCRQSPEPVLRTEQVNLQKIEIDKPFNVELLTAIGGVAIKPQPEKVQASVQVKSLTEQMPITVSVRIVEPVTWLSAKDNTWREYELVRLAPLEWRKQIIVTGPKQDLELLKAREQEVTAFVTLKDEDKKFVESWITRKVVVNFPPDLQVKLAPGENPTVQFKLGPIH